MEGIINTLSWLTKRSETGMKREKAESFEDLKGTFEEKRVEQLNTDVVEKAPQKTDEELYDEALAVMATPDYAKGVEMMQKLAGNGYIPAQLKMGSLYEEGNRISKNDRMACEWYQKAAEQGNAEAQFNLGMMYYNGNGVNQNLGMAFQWWKKAAEQGDINAQNNVGYLYENGEGVVQNYELAVEWYEKAAQQGGKNSQRALAWMYSNGLGVMKDFELAVEWYKKAANQGDGWSQYSLGQMYDKGQGVLSDYKLAVEWYEKATEQENIQALRRLVSMPDIVNGRKYVPKEGAQEWVEKLAKKGNMDAQYILGKIYEGKIKEEEISRSTQLSFQCDMYVKRQLEKSMLEFIADEYNEAFLIDYFEALKWYEKAAEQGDVDAVCDMGTLLVKVAKYDFDESAKKAMSMFHKISGQNNPRLSMAMAKYAEKFRTVGDKEYYLERAESEWHNYEGYSQWNEAEILFQLGDVYEQQKKWEKACNSYRKASNKGHEIARFRLGRIYENGKYLKRDIESAKLYYRMSAEAGCEEAQQYLGKASKFEGQMEKTETMNNYKDKEEVEEKSGFFKRIFGRV